ncbi:MAG TPA: hypothetical protein VNB29_07555 [Chthoniobacterales bacterium]|nr:hypothetical protein [Chthoniobacterales bacterium]
MKTILPIFLSAGAALILGACASTQPSVRSSTAHQEKAQKLESGASPGSAITPEEVHH